MNKPLIPIGTFYITNVCNLTCENCGTWNNFRFKGHFDWEVTRPLAERWAEIADIKELVILGGEPFIHPDLDTWVYELKRLWPNAPDVRVATNGTLLKHNIQRCKDYVEAGVNLEISPHDPKWWGEMIEYAEQILEGRKYYVDTVNLGFLQRANQDPYVEVHRKYRNQHGHCLITIRQSYEFLPTAVERINNGVLQMHRSRPEVAHDNCQFWDCHHFINGYFYKCNVTALSDLLHRQFTVNKECQEILSRSAKLSPFQPIEEIVEFINNLDKPIEQCQLCPENPLEKTVIVYPLAKTKVKF